MSEAKKANAPAMEKSAAILEYLYEQDHPCTLTDICKHTRLPKSSVHTLLTTMEALSYIRKENNNYTLGIRLYSLGCRAMEHAILTQVYLPALRRLRDTTGFTVHLCMYENGKLTVLDKLDGPGVVQFKAYKGQRKRLNTSAGGKALAAFLPEDELQKVIAGGFDQFTATSIADAGAFVRHLAGIRKVGYSIDEGEGEVGVRCLGAPLFLYGGKVFGGVSITTISSQLPLQQISHYASLLLAAAAEISRALSYTGAYPLPCSNPELPHPYIEEIRKMTFSMELASPFEASV